MFLAVDIGNTNLKLCLIKENKVIKKSLTSTKDAINSHSKKLKDFMQ